MLKPDVKPTDPANLRDAITTYCQRAFGVDIVNNVSTFNNAGPGFNPNPPPSPLLLEFATDVQKHRDRISRDVRSSDASLDTSRQLITEYVALLQLLEGRFANLVNTNTKKTSTSSYKVDLVWYDTFRPKVKTQQSSFLLEKASCVYNLAALEGSSAVNQNRTATEEGSRHAIQLFCRSAGIFAFLRDFVATDLQGIATHDLSQSALHMWSCVMIAQANTCVYEKAVKEKKLRSLLAKLAMRVSNDYSQCLTAARKLTGSIGPQFAEIFDAQEKTFLAAAVFQQAMFEKENCEKTMRGWGECLARFKHAEQTVFTAGKSEYSDVGSLKSAIQIELNKVKHDCETIYFPPEVTDFAKLPIITTIEVSKPISFSKSGFTDPAFFDEAYGLKYKPVLATLLPKFVQSALQDYQMRQESVLFALDDEWKNSKQEVDMILSSSTAAGGPSDEQAAGACAGAMGGGPLAGQNTIDVRDLIASTLGVTTKGTSANNPQASIEPLPEETWAKIQDAASKGGVSGLTASLEALTEYDRICGSLLNECVVKLEEEMKDDNLFSQRIAQAGQDSILKREKSEVLQEQFRQNLMSYEKKLSEARKANEVLKARGEALMKNANVKWIGKTRAEIEQGLPASTTPSAAQLAESQGGNGDLSVLESHTNAVRQALQKLEQLEQQLRQKIDEAKNLIKNDKTVEGELLDAVNTTTTGGNGNAAAVSANCSGLSANQQLNQTCRQIVEGKIEQHLTQLRSASNSTTMINEDGTSMQNLPAISIPDLKLEYRKQAENLLNLYNTTVNARKSAFQNSERAKIITALTACANMLLTVLKDLADGINFYTRLGDFLRQCKQQISDYCFARSEEKSQLLASVRSGGGGGGGNVSAASPMEQQQAGSVPPSPGFHPQTLAQQGFASASAALSGLANTIMPQNSSVMQQQQQQPPVFQQHQFPAQGAAGQTTYQVAPGVSISYGGGMPPPQQQQQPPQSLFPNGLFGGQPGSGGAPQQQQQQLFQHPQQQVPIVQHQNQFQQQPQQQMFFSQPQQHHQPRFF
ncbi:unnamed protein product [Amoebophrya sp. A120]|nr:unnamed protein product [Amoebophrya sp. A120]|eukprot:GSA120T00007582001.1